MKYKYEMKSSNKEIQQMLDAMLSEVEMTVDGDKYEKFFFGMDLTVSGETITIGFIVNVEPVAAPVTAPTDADQ